MLSQAKLAAVRGLTAERSAPIEEYARGFARALVLRNSDCSDKYSAELQDSLFNYFESYGLGKHPRLSDWWTDHLGGRVAHAFNVFIPWCLDLSVRFTGARILEIGCGTGSSTVALAAYGESVVACDVHLPSIDVARIRVKEDGFAHKVTFLPLEPGLAELKKLKANFDIVVLYGVLEHMLPHEREETFKTIWPLLGRAGKVVVYETPNRLWPKDRHTTGLLGWSWLPPNLALRYGKWRRKFDKDLDQVGMRRLGYGITYAELLRLLPRAQFKIDYKYVREPLVQRALTKGLVNLFRAPRWGFGEYLNVIIEKVS